MLGNSPDERERFWSPARVLGDNAFPHIGAAEALSRGLAPQHTPWGTELTLELHHTQHLFYPSHHGLSTENHNTPHLSFVSYLLKITCEQGEGVVPERLRERRGKTTPISQSTWLSLGIFYQKQHSGSQTINSLTNPRKAVAVLNGKYYGATGLPWNTEMLCAHKTLVSLPGMQHGSLVDQVFCSESLLCVRGHTKATTSAERGLSNKAWTK